MPEIDSHLNDLLHRMQLKGYTIKDVKFNLDKDTHVVQIMYEDKEKKV